VGLSERDRHAYDYEKQDPEGQDQAELEQHAAELEALGLGIAPGRRIQLVVATLELGGLRWADQRGGCQR
jgi:hypothetical protein